MDIHGRDHRLRLAPEIDVRSVRVECRQHKGVLIPVTGIKMVRCDNGVGLRLYMEALCIYCNRYQYMRVKEGSLAGLEPFTWNR